ncbi:MAG: preprotein translocase subunit SecE [Candidatus Riflebacteria bacterium]|nr:preprotein translocase subunit SecE [Candidatus Riflebacteria bacterium]
MEKIRSTYKDFVKYLSDVWNEVRPGKGRVVWPGFDMIKQATWVVIVSSFGIGLFIGAMDLLLGEVLKLIIGGRM